MKKPDTGKTSKYGNDELYESPFDTYIFHPIGLALVDPTYKLGLTPNQITYLSTISTFISCHFILKKKLKIAICFYLLGYIFDCIDGRLARKYDLGSLEGAAMDLVSDVITNIVVLISLFVSFYKSIPKSKIIIILIFFIGLTICHGFTEAIDNYKKFGNDNFLKTVNSKYGNKKDLLSKSYVYINKNSYNAYRKVFPIYNEKKLNKLMCYLKYFGPGTYNVVLSLILFNLK